MHKKPLTLSSEPGTQANHVFAVADSLLLDRLAVVLIADIIEAQEAHRICDLMSEMLTRNPSSAIAGALDERWTTASA